MGVRDFSRPFRGAFQSLANPNYRLWAAGAFVSNIGTWMQRTAQDWLVLTVLTHRSATALGVVMALQFGPMLLFLPWAGFASDYFERRRLLMFTQAALGVLALALGVLTLTGAVRLWHVWIFAFLSGAVAAFDSPAQQTFVADLVGERTLGNAVALNSTSFNAARMTGPAIAGFCIAAVGTGWAFVLNGASFAAVLCSLALVRKEKLYTYSRATQLRGNLIQGFNYVRGRPDLLVILLMLFLIGAFGLNFAIFISTMAVTVFKAGPGGYGALTSVLAAGTTAGALISAGREKPEIAIIVNGALVFGLALGLAAFMPTYWLFGAALVVVGGSALILLNTSNSLLQLSTEPAMRGRVIAMRLAILAGSTPVGAPIIGWVADRFGPRAGLGIGAIAGLAAGLIGLRFLRSWRMRSQAMPLPLSTEDEGEAGQWS